ncbi:glutamate racemase [Myroides odoratus]|uniref:Glutamate racemase n=1 Tax=Myroides odoratus TaxID=256 RepID=A0A9Q7E8D4_MYROD|nr:glutamate racemase [Myroides odoratus]EHQ43124.1 glutamate racemase [Myroides odoratus DSM 2801]EKB06505.1 glutamate racemase [Myroides odoratus CIP 103059]QQU00466.1 glutamate racemase [Myroides odoratus]WQD57301.1 glutamate racemase [Myroides odoratus]STZ30394.1 Glutamate racemase [Myroides odoratus]
MKNTNPIGLFDSGIGGTTIWQEIHKLMPTEDTIFLADQKNAPYGTQTKEAILALSHKNVQYLVDQGCKLVVVACNTATTNAIQELRSSFAIPIIGIEPAIKPASLLTKTSTIGVLATKGTITSDLFTSKLKLYPNVKIIEQIGYNLVTLIESGQLHSQEMKDLLQLYLLPMVEQGMDTLVLGCTHYPYLTPIIKTLIPEHILIIDSGEAVAKHTQKILGEHHLLTTRTNKGNTVFYTNVDPSILQTFAPDDIQVQQIEF